VRFVFEVKKLLKGIKDLKKVRREAQTEETDCCSQKIYCFRHCEVSIKGEWVIAKAFQALLYQDMLPWISAEYPD
jgi:hypothetical protein